MVTEKVDKRSVFESFGIRQINLINFICDIQKTIKPSIFLAINPTFIKNPYLSGLPKSYIFEEFERKFSWLAFFFSSLFFVTKSLFLLLWCLVLHCFFKLVARRKVDFSAAEIIVDSFFKMELFKPDQDYDDKHCFPGLVKRLEASGKKFLFLPKLVNKNRNNRNLFSLWQIIQYIQTSQGKHLFLEYDVLQWQDFCSMFVKILRFPAKTLSFRVRETTPCNSLFNAYLIEDMKKIDFESIKRYYVGKRIGKSKGLKTVITWFENQSNERAFNLGLRESGFAGKIIGCQFFIFFPSYINAFPTDLDRLQKTSPDIVLVNGRAYLRSLERIKYEIGVALRYQKIFAFSLQHDAFSGDGTVLLSSYIVSETVAVIKFAKNLNTRVLIKVHPTQRPEFYIKYVDSKFDFVDKDLYDLFREHAIFITTASGSALEAVACGKSVIIIGSNDNLTACPMLEYGRGLIWDIVFEEGEILETHMRLLECRKRHSEHLLEIAGWYRTSFFAEDHKGFWEGFFEK